MNIWIFLQNIIDNTDIDLQTRNRLQAGRMNLSVGLTRFKLNKTIATTVLGNMGVKLTDDLWKAGSR
jgi:hypothetical protein